MIPSPRTPPSIRSILLFKLRYIGDVLLTTPAIRLLRQAYPEAYIAMVVNRGTEEVLRHNPHLNHVCTVDRTILEKAPLWGRLTHEWKVIKSLRDKHYDISMDFDSGERGAYMSFLSGIDLRIGFQYARGLRRLIFNRQIDIDRHLHTVERNLTLVEKTLGLKRKDDTLELYTGLEEERRVTLLIESFSLGECIPVIVHPGARYRSKEWPAERWSMLIDRIQGDLGYPVVITGGNKEKEVIRSITFRMKTPVRSLAGQTSVLELAALFRKAALFIGSDSGPMHIAAAVGTPVIALFGPTDPLVWGPWGDGHTVISKHLPCSPCKVTRCDRGKECCMDQISLEEVLDEVTRHMGKFWRKPGM